MNQHVLHAYTGAKSTITDSLSAGRQLSSTARILFLIVAAYLVLPLWDVPLLGLSISAPVYFLIALEVFFKHGNRFQATRKWATWAYLYLTALLVSLTMNSILTRGYELRTADVVTMVRYAYWVTIFLVTISIVATTDMGRAIAITLGISVLVLASLRLLEAVLFGKWGAWTRTELMSQNGYGILFSTFVPFGVWLIWTFRGGKRFLANLGILIILLALAGNGSRGSWIGTGAGIFTLLAVNTIASPGNLKQTLILIFPILIAAAFFALAPPRLLEPVSERWASLQQLEDDKSYGARQLMNARAQYLLENNPVFGVGIGHFTRTHVPLSEIDIPDVFGGTYNQRRFDTKSSHNSYLQLAAEVGLAGMLPFGFLMATLGLGGLRATIARSRRGDPWAVPMFAGFVGMSVHLWGLSGLTGTVVWFMYGLVAGVIARNTYLGREAQREH